MGEDEKLYHNEEKVIDVLENVFIFKDTHDKFTKLDLECIHDAIHLYKQEKEKNKLLIQGKFREVADKNSYIKDMYIRKDKINDIIHNLNNDIDYWRSDVLRDLENLLK